MRLLVADSSKLFQEIVKKVFADSDSQPVAVASGAEALAALRRESFDFICITLHLPDSDGIRLAREIRKLSGYAHAPIVLFTAEESTAIHREALMSGVTEVFQKQDVTQLANFAARFVLQSRRLEGRVLYVEDSASQALVVAELFRSWGLAVHVCASAEAAWDCFQQQNFDLVVTDIVLAGQMSGLMLANRIRRLSDDRGDVPILAITAFDDLARRIELFYLGVNDYAIKPVVAEELLARVRSLLQNYRLTQDIKRRKAIAETAARLSNIMVAHFDAQWRWTEVPANLCRLLGCAEWELLGHAESKLVQNDDRAEEAALRENLRLGAAPPRYTLEKRYSGRNGEGLWVYFDAMAIRDDQQEIGGYLAFILDITERKHAEIQAQLTAKVFEASREGILITDADQRIILANQAICKISGYTEDELLGRTPHTFNSQHHGPAFYQSLWQTLHSQGHWSGELFDRRKNGELYPTWLSISEIKDMHGIATHYVGIHRDLSEQHSLQDQIKRFANFDALTGLANRFHLNALLQDVLARAERRQSLVAVIFIDLDLFKRINESLGHSAGDRLLKAVANRLEFLCEKSDCLARLGGDEFALVRAGLASPEDAAGAAEAALAALMRPYDLDGHAIALSASLGISLYPSDGTSHTALLQKAEIAAHSAKTMKPGGFQFFSEDMEQAAVEKLFMENELRSALHEGQLLLFYQPQYHMADGRLIGWEALIRWQHPRLGMVPPAKFIPVAEDSRLIIDIGQWAMRTACLQSRQWQQLGYPKVPIAVNISAIQFRTSDFYQSVAQALLDAGVEGDCLELELTESILMGEEESVINLLHSLKGLGVALSIDDFGTGYSSLSYLKRFPVDRLKIDQAFVRNATEDPNDAAIITAIVNMAKGLQLGVIAEGVETGEQAELLLQCGCFEAQGYYFGKPSLAQDAEKHLSASACPPSFQHKAFAQASWQLPFSPAECQG